MVRKMSSGTDIVMSRVGKSYIELLGRIILEYLYRRGECTVGELLEYFKSRYNVEQLKRERQGTRLPFGESTVLNFILYTLGYLERKGLVVVETSTMSESGERG